MCKSVNNEDILNNLKDILLDFASIWKWVKDNWYWVLGGFAAVGKEGGREGRGRDRGRDRGREEGGRDISFSILPLRL